MKQAEGQKVTKPQPDGYVCVQTSLLKCQEGEDRLFHNVVDPGGRTETTDREGAGQGREDALCRMAGSRMGKKGNMRKILYDSPPIVMVVKVVGGGAEPGSRAVRNGYKLGWRPLKMQYW